MSERQVFRLIRKDTAIMATELRCISLRAPRRVVKETRPSWIRLILYCAANATVTALAFALIVTGSTLFYAVAPSHVAATSDETVPSQTFSGMITDAYCGAKHRLPDKASAECTRICVTRGSNYILIDGDKVYGLQGDIVKLNRMAGERVTITGSLHGHTIDVASMSDSTS